MEYWVYENWTAEHKAVVHSATCGFCNHGRGGASAINCCYPALISF